MVMYDGLNKMLKVGDMAEILCVSPNTLRRWADKGAIESYRIRPRGDRRCRQSDVANLTSKI
ncbi:helix-turn-helix domain-containing protein [Chloroflexota bacterium]